GRVDLTAWESALGEPAAVACLQAANAEVGTRQPIAHAAALAHDRGVPLLVDATQVVGRDDIPPDWDLLTASARDWGGPAGVGILAVRASARWIPEQTPDRGWVGGFPDIAAAAAAATALEYLRPVAARESTRLRELVDELRAELPAVVAGLELAGDPVDRLPHILTFTCADVTGEILVTELDRRGVAVASGSACTADNRMPSHVLAAMGISSDASVRVSLPFGCAEATIRLLIHQLPDAVATVRARFDS
ncbi:MAG: aminotransferase class V-fold PLP-dependent enzyme, partial [bacterium]|nr:aminotransferase class V-fold PLP-dependent enzyme [bacterium]